MKVISTKESDSERRYMKVFTFDDTIQIDSLIDVVKQFENEQVKMLVCHCDTYDANDRRLYYGLSSLDEVKEVYRRSPSPYFDFSIDFGSRENESYLFSLVTSINSNSVIYEVDKKKLNAVSQKTHSNGRR